MSLCTCIYTYDTYLCAHRERYKERRNITPFSFGKFMWKLKLYYSYKAVFELFDSPVAG